MFTHKTFKNLRLHRLDDPGKHLDIHIHSQLETNKLIKLINGSINIVTLWEECPNSEPNLNSEQTVWTFLATYMFNIQGL